MYVPSLKVFFNLFRVEPLINKKDTTKSRTLNTLITSQSDILTHSYIMPSIRASP